MDSRRAFKVLLDLFCEVNDDLKCWRQNEEVIHLISD